MAANIDMTDSLISDEIKLSPVLMKPYKLQGIVD